LGYTKEVADLVYFLTVQNSYISGQNIVIDGGYSCTAK
jgi:NAD(P)-dependent dehydrogenase (short-subunit alcohol dehydrogenase family)